MRSVLIGAVCAVLASTWSTASFSAIEASGLLRSSPDTTDTGCDAPRREPPPRSLSVTYFGTSTLAITDGRTTIVTDAFFSRPGLQRWALPLRPNRVRINAAYEHLPRRVAAIFVAHSHHDHVLDTAEVARDLDSRVYGSASTQIAVTAAGLSPSRVHLLGQDTVVCGDFTIESVLTNHTPPGWPRGELEFAFAWPAFVWSFRGGDNYSFVVRHGQSTILMVPSANLASDPKVYDGIGADIVFLGIGSMGRRTPEDFTAYWHQTVTGSGAPWVVPIHWDDFTRGLEKPLRPMPWPIDDVSKTFEAIDVLAGDTVRVQELDAYETLVVGT